MLRPFIYRDGSGTPYTLEQLTEILQSQGGYLTVTVSDRDGDDTKAATNGETAFKTLQAAADYLIGKGNENTPGSGKRRVVLVEPLTYRENLNLNPAVHQHITFINTGWFYRAEYGQLAFEAQEVYAQISPDSGDALTISPLTTPPTMSWTLQDSGAVYTGGSLIDLNVPSAVDMGTIGFVGFTFNPGAGRGVNVVGGAKGSADSPLVPMVYFTGCSFGGSAQIAAAFKTCSPRLTDCSYNTGKVVVMDNVYTPAIINTGQNYSWGQGGMSVAGELYINIGAGNPAVEGSPYGSHPGVISCVGADFKKIVTKTGDGYNTFEDSLPNTQEVVSNRIVLNGFDKLGDRNDKPLKKVHARQGIVMNDASKLIASEVIVDVSGGIVKTSTGSLSIRRGSIRGDVTLSNGTCVLEDVSIVGNVTGTGSNTTLINCRVNGNVTGCQIENTTVSGVVSA